jgi:hypothetical protein
MTEQVVPGVIRCLDSYAHSVRWIHFPDSRGMLGSRGFPDFVIAGPRGLLFRECKPRPDSHLSPSQTAWRWMLLAAGADYAVWTQQDLDDGTIERQIDTLRSEP